MVKKIMPKEIFDQLVAEFGHDFAMTEFRKTLSETIQYETKFKHNPSKWLKEEKKDRIGEVDELKKELRQLKKKNSKKLKKQIKKREWTKQLENFAQAVRNKEVKSETWFRKLYKEHQIETIHDQYNVVFFKTYIPDVMNKKHKYIIEIDGTIHLQPSQIEKDKTKDMFYKSKGYTVFRIKYLDVLGYIETMDRIIKIKKLTPSKEYLNYVKTNKVVNNL